MGPIPDAHGIVAEHDRLAMYGDFCKVVEPRKLISQLASFFVVIAGERKDLPATNVLAVLQNPRLASGAEISQEIESVIRLHRSIQTFKDRLIHLLDTSKRAIAVVDYVVMPEMKICGEPYVRHKSL
jgi:hypothetical protein